MADQASKELALEILKKAKTIAVLGAHWREQKAAFYVPQYMLEQGYVIIPVNPAYTDREMWGKRPVATLAEVDGPVDVVNVFRRSEAVIDHVDDILAMDPLPTYVWLQLAIRNDEAKARLEEAGIRVVQDRCMLADHRAWL